MFKRSFLWCLSYDEDRAPLVYDTAKDLLYEATITGSADLYLIVRWHDQDKIPTTEKRFTISDARLPSEAPLDAIRELADAVKAEEVSHG